MSPKHYHRKMSKKTILTIIAVVLTVLIVVAGIIVINVAQPEEEPGGGLGTPSGTIPGGDTDLGTDPDGGIVLPPDIFE